MSHHKRHRPKSTRAGCIMCKPWKDQRRKDSVESQTLQERRALLSDRELDEQLDDAADSE